jgi:hypothetical protein
MQPDDTVRIPLRARDGSVRAYALVDAADAEWANQWRWSLNEGYAHRGTTVNGRDCKIYLHREILGLTPGDGLEGDHIDRDRLNNRRSNLRVIPKRAQQQNISTAHRSSSIHRGVSWDKSENKWRVSVRHDGRQLHGGYFTSEDDAAIAARNLRLRLMPYATD